MNAELSEKSQKNYERGRRLGMLCRRLGEDHIDELRSAQDMSDSEFTMFLQNIAVRNFKKNKSRLRVRR